MKKLFKILVVLVGGVLVLMLVGSVLLHMYLPPEKAKALVLEHLSAQLKREVEVGSVSVGLLSGLEMSNLKISESPTFSKGTFISSDLFTLKIALTPLLFRKVVVRQILLKGPKVHIVRDADGKTFNFSDLTTTTVPKMPESGTVTPTGSKESFPFLLVVSRAEIQKGALYFEDHSPAQASLDISPFDLKLKSVSLISPFSVQTDMHVKTKGKAIAIHLAGEANLLAGTFKITKGAVEVGPVKATVGGSLSQLKTPEPACKIHIETNNIPIRDALKFAPTPLPEGVVLDGTTRLSVDVSGTASNAQFAAKWIGTDLLIAKGDDFAKPTGVPLEVSMIGSRPSPDDIVVSSLVAKLGANEVTGAGTYKTAGKVGLMDFAAKGTKWSIQDLAKISPVMAPYHPTGNLSFQMHATGPVNAPQTTLATSASIASTNFKQEYYEGQNLQLNWNLTDITPDLAKVNGTATLKQGPGKILNVEKLASNSRIGKIALAPLETLAKLQNKGVLKQVNLPSLQTITFESLAGDYLLKSGVMTIKTFSMNGRDLSVDDQGTVGLAGAQPLNMNVAMKLAAGSIGGSIGSVINDASGRPTFKFKATGTVANPIVKWDVQEVEKKAIQQVGQEIMKNKDVQNAVDDLGNTLKGIFH